MKAFQADISRAESNDRLLQGKRIERHDGSGDRQKCRPPFCVGGNDGRLSAPLTIDRDAGAG